MVKNMPANAGDIRDASSIPGSPGGGNGNPLQYSCLQNPHGQKSLVGYSTQDYKESDTTEATEHASTQSLFRSGNKLLMTSLFHMTQGDNIPMGEFCGCRSGF